MILAVGDQWWVELPYKPATPGLCELRLAKITLLTESTVGLCWSEIEEDGHTKVEGCIGQFETSLVRWVEEVKNRKPLSVVQ